MFSSVHKGGYRGLTSPTPWLKKIQPPWPNPVYALGHPVFNQLFYLVQVSLDPPGGNLSQVFIPQYGNYPPNLDLDGLPYGETVFEDIKPGKQYKIR